MSNSNNGFKFKSYPQQAHKIASKLYGELLTTATETATETAQTQIQGATPLYRVTAYDTQRKAHLRGTRLNLGQALEEISKTLENALFIGLTVKREGEAK